MRFQTSSFGRNYRDSIVGPFSYGIYIVPPSKTGFLRGTMMAVPKPLGIAPSGTRNFCVDFAPSFIWLGQAFSLRRTPPSNGPNPRDVERPDRFDAIRAKRSWSSLPAADLHVRLSWTELSTLSGDNRRRESSDHRLVRAPWARASGSHVD